MNERQIQRRPLIGMVAFTLQRLAFSVLVLAAIAYLSYLGLSMARGIPFRPALVWAAGETVTYGSRLARGDLGLSVAGSVTLRPVPVAEVLPEVLPRSLGLLAAALLIATLVGVALGTWAASHRHSGWSLVTLLASIAGISVPSFFAALLLQMAMLRWARTVGRPLVPMGGFGWDRHIVLPALVLAARPIAQIVRMTFVSLSEVLERDYVRTAHSKGLAPRQVMNRHVIRNAAIPILTTVGTSLRFSLSSLPVVEFFFGWPGLGFTLLKAISRQDDNLTVALILCLGALFMLVNLMLEVSYRWIDPRLRETSAQVGQGERETVAERVRVFLADLRDLVVDHPFSHWLARRRNGPSPSPFREVLERNRVGLDVTPEEYRAERRRAWLRGTLGNLPFVAGAILVAGLGAVVFFGPRLAPHSPYTTHGLVIEEGEFRVPPYAPDETYRWGTDVLGRDMLSLILAGAQRTLFLAALVVLARMVVGFVVGAVAGWWSGSWVDRLLMGAAETIAAFPTLLLAMTLILALGIRQGMRPFVIALCFVGWGEIMQYVRGEVMAIRPRLFIESAVAVGLRTSRIVLSHVLPNLIPALISIAALEIGAVLMVLGELGFIGIFIGGGAFADLSWLAPPFHYSDLPEWGALLSNMRTYARTYPWMGIYPASAFFVAILGFNLLGEGVRRMVEHVGMGIVRLVNRYTVALSLLVVLGAGWARGNTGTVAFYRRQAVAFDGERALAHVEALAAPAMEGRALGTEGMEAAAEWIARQVKALGIQAAGEDASYFQTRKRSFECLDAVPRLIIEDGGPPLAYQQEFVEYPGTYRSLGQVQAPVRFFAMGEMTTGQFGNYPALKGMDFSDAILLLSSDRDAFYLDRAVYDVPRGGILVVAGDAEDLRRRHTLSSRDFVTTLTGEQIRQDVPMLWISEAAADRILRNTGHTVADLRRRAETLMVNELFELPTGVTASLEVHGTVHEKVPARHVIGHLPGRAGSIEGAPQAEAAKLDDHLIVVLAQYDSPPPGPEGVFTPAANDNASGVAVMLEAIRTMQETGYQPYRTFLFVAYSGEGLEEGGEVSPLEVATFLQAKQGFSTSFEVEAVVELRGLGAGQGDGLVLSAGGNLRLAGLFEAAARWMGVDARRGGEAMDLSIVFEERGVLGSGQEAPHIGLSWEGWEATSRLPADRVDTVSAEKLERAGRALTLALMILGRETQY